MLAESEIHSKLKRKFSRGDVYCSGCAGMTEKKTLIKDVFKKKEFDTNGFKLHVEWFAVPKKALPEVYEIVDSVCVKYAS